MAPTALHIAPHKHRPLHEHTDRPQDKDSAVQALLIFDSPYIHALVLQLPIKSSPNSKKHLGGGREKSKIQIVS